MVQYTNWEPAGRVVCLRRDHILEVTKRSVLRMSMKRLMKSWIFSKVWFFFWSSRCSTKYSQMAPTYTLHSVGSPTPSRRGCGRYLSGRKLGSTILNLCNWRDEIFLSSNHSILRGPMRHKPTILADMCKRQDSGAIAVELVSSWKSNARTGMDLCCHWILISTHYLLGTWMKRCTFNFLAPKPDVNVTV